jgi:acyl-coenzyme A thioesterase PaaI-like protein
MNSLKKDNLIAISKKSSDHNCFGCGPDNDFGLKMEFYTNKERDAVYSWLAVPDHVSGWGSVVHGGIVTTILDEAMGWAAAAILQKFFLTKTLTTNFYQPVFIGQEIFVSGDVLETRNNREAEVQAAIYDSNGKLSASATSAISILDLETIKEKQLFKGRLLREIETSISELALE